MRRSIASAALFAAIAATACTDTPPTGTPRPPNVTGPLMTGTLEDYIQQQIDKILPKGFEDAVDARWSTVKSKKLAGDFAGAEKHLTTLSVWIRKKVLDITPAEGQTKEQAAVGLMLNMSRWLYEGEGAEVFVPGEDVAVEVVAAGAPAEVLVPSEHAGVRFDGNNTDEERVIIVAEDETPYPTGEGPLTTSRFQFPLYYRFESIPNKPLKDHGNFAVCMPTEGERTPLEYTSTHPRWGDLPEHEKHAVHEHMRLAKPAPADPAKKTAGSVIEGEIEILALSADQKSSTVCAGTTYGLAPNLLRGGWLGRGQRAMHAIANIAGWLLTPKNLYAYDSGPEHDGNFASPFNGVCYAGPTDDDQKVCRPDLSVASLTAPTEGFGGDEASVTFSVENRSRRQGGESTGESSQTSAALYLFEIEGGTEPVAGPLAAAVTVNGMAPNDPAQTFTQTFILPDNITLDKDYLIGAVVDPGTGIPEVGHPENANNTKTARFRLKKKKADLAFRSGFTISPTTVDPGGSITTSSWTVENIGNAVSGQFDARFYLRSATGTLRQLGVAIAHASIGFAADANSATHAGVELTIPSDAQPGTYDVLLRLDPGNDVEELRDDNNEAAPQQLVVEQRDVPIVLNLTAVEKLPGGTQRFVVQQGTGPYTWSVNGIDGGNATFGTIAVFSANEADYTAPAAVPNPPTFDVCARRDAKPTNKACAAVTIKPVPSSGTDVVVFNDINFFDDFPAQNPNNIRLYTNLVDYTAPGARSDQTGVMIHFGHNSVCCGPSYIQTLINTYNGRGNPVTVVDNPAATISSVPAAIKLLFLVLPNTPYSDAEINVLKQFAGEGGRIVFIGEHGGFYPTQIETVENPFLAKMGAQLTNTGATIDCGYNTLPQTSIRPHQITEGLTNVTMACASQITLGPNDYALVYGSDGVSIIAAVARIDVTPLPLAALAKSPAPLFSQSSAVPAGEDPVGAKYAKPAP